MDCDTQDKAIVEKTLALEIAAGKKAILLLNAAGEVELESIYEGY